MTAFAPSRGLALAAALTTALVMAACAGPSLPEPPLLDLSSARIVPLVASAVVDAEVWQLMSPVRVPTALDREAVMVVIAPGQLQPWRGLRWSESPRDSTPRVLLQDLRALRGASRVWSTALPAGVSVDRQLRIDISEWQADVVGGEIRLQAQWSLAQPSGALPVRVGQTRLALPWQPADAAALAQAQRRAIQMLASAIANTPR